MRTFYPPIEPYDAGRLSVSPLHTLYYPHQHLLHSQSRSQYQ